MFRRSIYILYALHTPLHKVALQAKMSVSQFLNAIVERESKCRDDAKLDHLYVVLGKLNGLGPSGVTHTSVSIDEMLYGAQPDVFQHMADQMKLF